MAIVASLVVTTLAVYLYGLQAGVIWREHIFDYFIGWADVLAVSAGAFHLIEEAPKAAADPNGFLRKLTGTGDGNP